MPEDYPAKFEKETGIKVRLEYYESMEELVSKLRAGGVSQYDLVVPSDYIVTAMVNLGLLQELDHSKIPNMKNLDDFFINPAYDPGNKYTVAYQWGTIGLFYNKEKFTGEPTLADIFDAKKNNTHFMVIDSIRETMSLVFCYLGKDVNTSKVEDLKEAADVLIGAKKNPLFSGFDISYGIRSKVSGKNLDIGTTYNGAAIKYIAANPGCNLGFVNPEEGAVAWADNMAIPAKAPNPDYAYTFINWILDPQIGAGLSNYAKYASPNKASKPFIDPEFLNHPGVYPPAEYKDKLHFIKDVGKDSRLYDEVWTMIKAR